MNIGDRVVIVNYGGEEDSPSNGRQGTVLKYDIALEPYPWVLRLDDALLEDDFYDNFWVSADEVQVIVDEDGEPDL